MDLNQSIKSHPAFSKSSPYIKAVEFIGRTVTRVIKNVGEDTFERQGQEPQTKFVLFFTNDEAMVLNNTNRDTLIAAFTDIPGKWIGSKILLSTKQYDIEGKITHGFMLHMPPEEDGAPFDDEIRF